MHHMKVVYFSKASEIGPSSRYRIFQYLPHLSSQGVDVTVRPLFGPTYFSLLTWRVGWLRVVAKAGYVMLRFARRAADLLSLGRTDLIVIEGQLFPYAPATAERFLAKMKRRLVIELDDAIYLTPFHQRKMPVLLRLSSAAIVGNRVLAAYAGRFAPRVAVIPTVVDTDRFRPAVTRASRQDPKDLITIVWAGLAFNFPYLQLLAPVLKELQRTELVRFRVISSRPPALPGVSLDFKVWSLEDEVVDLQSGHIGVMPLLDTEWARGKCGLKLLQYMALGLPAVASPVGVNQEIISEGQNGFLASTQDEWYTALLRLCRDAELRSMIGSAARKTVEQEYALSVWGPRLVDSYRAIINDNGSPGSVLADKVFKRQ